MVHEVVDIEVQSMTAAHITKLLADAWSVLNVTSKESPTLTGHNGSVSVSIDAAVAGSWSTLLHPLLVIIQGGTHIIPLAGHPDLLYFTTLNVVSWSPNWLSMTGED